MAFTKFELLTSPSLEKIRILSILFLTTQRDPRKFPVSTAVHVLAFPSSYLKVPTDCHNTASPHQAKRLDSRRLTTFDLHGQCPYGNEHLAEALEYYTSSRNCFQKAGMNLRQWTSNSPTLNRQARDDGVHAEPMVKVLELNWNTKILCHYH